MPVTEVVQSLGSWELQLRDTTPDYVASQLNPFGHVVIVDGPVDDVAGTGNSLLGGARYVGVCRELDKAGGYTRGGDGLIYWLGDEDGKGWTLLTEISLTNATLAQVVAALLPPTVTVGTVHPQADPAARYTGKHIFQSRREALAVALAVFGAELRVNGDFTVDVGTPSQLYRTATPDTIIKRRAVGADIDLTAIGGSFDVGNSAKDYSTGVTVVGQTIGTGGEPDTTFALATATAPSVPWKDPQGNPVKLHRLVSASTETTSSAPATAALNLNRFNRTTTSVKVTAADFEVQGSFNVGDATYVYDPDTGIVNPGLEVFFRGEALNPDIVRVTSLTTPIVEGMTVAWRTDAGVWIDLTPWVVWESTGTRELVVGDLPRTLFKSGTPNGAVQDRVDAARGNPSTKQPKAPTGLALTTSSTANAQGRDSSVITAAWDPVTQYVDGTAVALSHYEVQFRPQFRSPLWTGSALTTDLSAVLPVTAALGYDVQVRAVSTGGVASAWSASASIISAADSTGPSTPSDPVVTQYLGLLRIYWNGLDSTGGPMPSDFNRVDVHVGTSSGFTASAATLVSSLSAAGYAHAQAPYGSTRFVRFLAYDHNGNPSAASATISGATVQAADGDIAALSVGKLTAGILSADVTISGRFTTAPTGARREMNSIGFQAFDASNNLTINLDGVNNLLTGTFQTGLTGRRIVLGAAGAVGVIKFLAPDGTTTELGSFTGVGGGEVIRLGVVTDGVSQFWNKHQIQGDGAIYSFSAFHKIVVGGDGPEAGKSFQISYATGRGSSTDNTIPDSLRVSIDASNTMFFQDPGQGFYVADRSSTGSRRDRIWVDSNGDFWLTRLPPKVFSIDDLDSGGTRQARFTITDDDTIFRWFGTNSKAWVRKGFGDVSARLLIQNAADYGTTLRFVSATDGTSQRLELTGGAETGYVPVHAASFVVSSSETQKTAVTPFTDDALSVLKGMQPVRFRRKGLPDTEDKHRAPDGPVEIGFIAEDLPPLVMARDETGDPVGRDLAAEVAVLIAAVQQLDTRTADMKGGVR